MITNTYILNKLKENGIEMNLNFGTGNSFFIGCLVVDVIYIALAIWCFYSVVRVVKNSSFSTFGAANLVSMIWYGALGAMFSFAFFVSLSSGYYEYQKILNATDAHYGLSVKQSHEAENASIVKGALHEKS